MITIIHKTSGKVLFTGKEDLKEVVYLAIRQKVDLSNANLSGADLHGAYLPT